MPKKSSTEERLQKIIARAGKASRRAAEQMIVEGRVQVDGRVVKELGAKADPERSDIRVDGTRIRLEHRRRYIVLNKPRGYVTTRSDPGGRPTVMELLPHSLRSLYPVGRLDMSSTGLLVLTNDGDFAQQVGHPRFGIEKTYLVTVRGAPSDRMLDRAQKGIRVDGERLKVKSVHVLGSRRRGKLDTSTLSVVLVEGKNREVRRLFKALGHPVLELHRSKVGVLSDRGLPEGMFRPLSSLEIRQLKSPRGARAARPRRGSGRSVEAQRAKAEVSAARSRRPSFSKSSASAGASVDKPRRSPKGEGGRRKSRREGSPSSRIPRDPRKAGFKGDRHPEHSPAGKARRNGEKLSYEGDSMKMPRARLARGSRRIGGKGKLRAASKASNKPGRRAKKGV
jgi:pseudouridine synthase